MRIVSWNCNGAFRKKYSLLQKYDADVLVIQECENPASTTNIGYQLFASKILWKGRRSGKGLGIFALKGNIIEDNEWDATGLEIYISFRVNNDFDVLGVWACNNYIEDFYDYCFLHQQNLENKILCGDLNSNRRWDKKHGMKNHSTTTALLEKAELYSCYHCLTGEQPGEETTPTFYMYRNAAFPYHIDYAFAPKSKVLGFMIGAAAEWLPYSDHMPIILDVSF